MSDAAPRRLTSHEDGFGLNETLRVEALDAPGPGGACHRYRITVAAAPGEGTVVGELTFQRGPRLDPQATPGLTEGAVLAVLIDRLEAFSAGPFPSVESADALRLLRLAQDLLKRRAAERAARGVLGRAEP